MSRLGFVQNAPLGAFFYAFAMEAQICFSHRESSESRHSRLRGNDDRLRFYMNRE